MVFPITCLKASLTTILARNILSARFFRGFFLRAKASLSRSLSGQVGMDDLGQLFGGKSARVVARRRRVHDMLADMVLDDLGDERVERPPAGRRLLQDRRAGGILVERPLHRLELTANPANPVQQLLLLLQLKCHSNTPSSRGV